MLGSTDDAEDAVQEAWLRISRSGSGLDHGDLSHRWGGAPATDVARGAM